MLRAAVAAGTPLGKEVCASAPLRHRALMWCIDKGSLCFKLLFPRARNPSLGSTQERKSLFPPHFLQVVEVVRQSDVRFSAGSQLSIYACPPAYARIALRGGIGIQLRQGCYVFDLYLWLQPCQTDCACNDSSF